MRDNFVKLILPTIWLIVASSPIGLAAAPDSSTSRDNKTALQSPQVLRINEEIRSVWTELHLKPSSSATDGEWCRRVYLDLIGRVPTLAELDSFLKQRPAERKKKLVSDLLYGDQYRSEYVRHWSSVWSNILIGRTGGNRNNSLISRAGMTQYLKAAFEQNRPYDQFVKELISAKGSSAPGTSDFNGATNFLVMKLAENATQATAETSKIFLGLQIQCTQCHNHPFNDWKQQKFWELNAFFRQTAALRRFNPGSRDIRFVELANQDFAGESGTPEEAEIYYEMRNGYLKPAYPTFVDGRQINRSGFVEDVDRRDELAKLIVGSEWLAKAQVNRLWGHFLGYGFTQPIEDMGPHNPPTHPELLEYLASEFKANSFDLKRLMEWIVLSEAYSLSSRSQSQAVRDDPLLGETPKFSRFYMRQMSVEQLYESLLVTTQADRGENTGDQQVRRDRWLGQFSRAFGTDEGGESTTFDGTISQQLMMFNGDLMRAATNPKNQSLLGQVSSSNAPASRKINYLYRAALARKPSAGELNFANRLLLDSRGNSTEALQDIWWAILNSNEFILIH